MRGALPGERLAGGPWGQQGAAGSSAPSQPGSPGSLHSSPPGIAGFGPFSLPSRSSTTNPTSDESLHFHFVSPAGICPDTFTVSVSPTGVWVGRICSGRGWKIPQKPLAPAPQSLQHATGCWQIRSPVGSGETKPDLTRGNKYIKVKEKIEEALGRGGCTGMRLSCPENKFKRNPKHCSGPRQVEVKPPTNSVGL